MLEVLLVAPEVEALHAGPHAGRVRLVTASELVAARAFLAGTAFDLVVVSDGEPRWEADLASLSADLGLSTPVVSIDTTDTESFSEALIFALQSVQAEAIDPGSIRAGDNQFEPSKMVDEEVLELLLGLRNEMSTLVHSLNNPLAVISGNAQLGAEIASSIDADPTLIEAFRDIDVAALELGALFSDVTRLRARIEDVLVNVKRGEGGE